MGWFSKSAKTAQKNAQARDEQYRIINNALMVPNDAASWEMAMGAIIPAMYKLLDDHMDDPLTRPFLLSTVDKIVKRNAQDAFHVLIYLFNRTGDNGDVLGRGFLDKLVEKTFNFFAFATKDNLRHMSSMAGLSQMIAERAVEGSLMETRAIRYWGEAFDVLAADSRNGYALAAVCNAVVVPRSRKLSSFAAEKWETLMVEISFKDKKRAKALTAQYYNKCKEFADRGAPVWRAGALAKFLNE